MILRQRDPANRSLQQSAACTTIPAETDYNSPKSMAMSKSSPKSADAHEAPSDAHPQEDNADDAAFILGQNQSQSSDQLLFCLASDEISEAD